MRYYELQEGPNEDLSNVREAQRIVEAFASYLGKMNEDTPLEDLRSFIRINGGRNTYLVISNYHLDLPEYDDLKIGFSWRSDVFAGIREETRAMLARGTDEGRRIYFATFHLDHDPSKDTDIAYGLRWDDMVHEIVHYLDYKRGLERNGINRHSWQRNKRIAARQNSGSNYLYYNDPLEFNAWYQQANSNILKRLVFAARQGPEKQEELRKSALGSFEDFRRAFLHEFDYVFRDSLFPLNKRRFERRMFRLYEFIRDHFPDIQAIKDAIKAQEAVEARFKDQD